MTNGNSVLFYGLYAVRSDGSKVEANLPEYPKLTNAVRGISLVSERKYVIVTDLVQSISTNYLSDTAVSRLRMNSSDSTCSPPAGTMSPHSVAGAGTFLGFRIIRIQLGKPGAVETEFWNAPDLDCYPLRQIMEFRDATGNVTELSDDSVISVSRGEPSAELFSIPADYVERPPSEVERLDAEKTGIPLDHINAARAARIDQRYYDSRKYARR